MLRPKYILGRFAFGKTRRGPRCARQARQRLARSLHVKLMINDHAGCWPVVRCSFFNELLNGSLKLGGGGGTHPKKTKKKTKKNQKKPSQFTNFGVATGFFWFFLGFFGFFLFFFGMVF